MSISRREWFQTALALASTNALPLKAQANLGGMPFALGVGSDEPAADAGAVGR